VRRAVVLLSGGLDSAVTLASARAEGFACYALSVDYGQRHARELDAAKLVARQLGAAGHVTVAADLRATAASSLTGSSDVPKDRTASEMGKGVPSTYVPARNTVLLALALGYAETLRAADLFIGANALDFAGYPDCRPEFLRAFEALANLGTKSAGWRVHAPLLRLTKAEIVTVGVKLGVDFALTWSCYDPTPAGKPCGRCDACVLRREGFAAACVPDPAGA
jgi:7-cyano-7-deazaguanine synthase